LTHNFTVDFSRNAILTDRGVQSGTFREGLTDFAGRSIGEPLAVFELVAVVVAVIRIGGNGTSKIFSLLAFSFDKTLQFGWLSEREKKLFSLLS
jgi:hypothetical protein